MNKIELRKKIVGVFGVIFTLTLLGLIVNFYKYVYMNYCLYETSGLVLPNTNMYSMITMVTLFPITLEMIPVVATICSLLVVSVSIIVKRK